MDNISSGKWIDLAQPGPLNEKIQKKKIYSNLKIEISKNLLYFLP